MTEKVIDHTGYISNISTQEIEVTITVSSACSSCHAKGACTSADSAERIITIRNTGKSSYKMGDIVSVTGAQSLGMSAVFFAYIIPFLLVFISLLIFTELSEVSEIQSGLLSLLVLPPYYIGLYFFKEKLEKKYTFTIN